MNGQAPPGDTIACYLSAPSPCSYLPGRQSRSLFIDPALPMSAGLYGLLLEQGFRRSGELVYRHRCDACRRCIPVRLPVTRFRPRRIQRRVWKRWRQVEVIDRGDCFDPLHFDLYRRYLESRHADGGMAGQGEADYRSFLRSDWSRTRFIEFRLGGGLAAVAVTDRVPGALSSVYTFFDPGLQGWSPGVFTLLWQIREAERLGLEWLYLGFWIPGCRKMEYKAGYRPLQALTGGCWHEVEPGMPMPSPEM